MRGEGGTFANHEGQGKGPRHHGKGQTGLENKNRLNSFKIFRNVGRNRLLRSVNLVFAGFL